MSVWWESLEWWQKFATIATVVVIIGVIVSPRSRRVSTAGQRIGLTVALVILLPGMLIYRHDDLLIISHTLGVVGTIVGFGSLWLFRKK